MKILITESMDRGIDGYYSFPVVHGNVKLNDIPRNACESIVVDQCIDRIKEPEVINSLCRRLRKEGVVVITGTDILVLAQNLINKKTTIEEFSNYAQQTKSFWSVENLINTLKGYRMEIISATLQGVRYEIRARRSK